MCCHKSIKVCFTMLFDSQSERFPMISRRNWFNVLLAGLTACLLWSASARAAEDDGWQTIFDGKTLDGWDGNPDFWRVEDGAITGETTKDKPTKGNTFIIWKK